MIISIGAEKMFDKMQHNFNAQNTRKNRVVGTFLNIVKVIYANPTDNIILNGEKLKAFPLKSGKGRGCPFCHFYSTSSLKH